MYVGWSHHVLVRLLTFLLLLGLQIFITIPQTQHKNKNSILSNLLIYIL